MRIFVSYASENRPVAEPIVHSIRARGHKVFFDKHDLPPGQSYEEQIETAIARSDVFVFLVSPHSVEQGGFARTELRMAEQKWPRPAGRVLPVMLAPTDLSKVPAYLQAISILEPSGSIAAETAASVDQMRRFRLRWPMAAAAVLFLALAAAGIYMVAVPKPDITIRAKSLEPATRGYFGAQGEYVLMTEAENQGRLSGRLVAVRLDVTPPNALTILKSGPAYSRDAPTFVNAGAATTQHFLVTPTTADVSGIKWRVCLTEEISGETCSPEQAWAPSGEPSPATAFSIPSDLSARAVAVARHGEGFILLARKPGLLQEIHVDGTLGLSLPIDGEPTALYADQAGIFVGTRGPNSLLRVRNEDLTMIAKTAVTFPSTASSKATGRVSSTPVSIGRGAGRIWAVTSGGSSRSGLMHFDLELSDPKVPDYFSGRISFDLDGLLLASNGDEVWGTHTNITPATLYHITPSELRQYSGHDYDIASCATGVLVRTTDILVPDCGGNVQSVGENDVDGLQINAQIDQLPDYNRSAGTWIAVQMRPSPGDGIAFLVKSANRKVTSSVATLINSTAMTQPVIIADIRIIDIAAQKEAFVAILENEQGERETLALKYQ